MPALATLATTTLVAPVLFGDQEVQLTSTSDLVPKLRLYINRELLEVIRVAGLIVTVRRGVDGTATGPHPAGATVTIGRGDQFYHTDPVGVPPSAVLVTPWINVLTGASWTPQGDEVGPGAEARVWEQAVTSSTTTVGALGVRTTTTASTR